MYDANTNPDISCPNCGGSIGAASRFCNHCGLNLTEHREVSETGVSVGEKQKIRTKVTLVTCGSITILIVALVVAYIYTRNRASSETPGETQTSPQTMSARGMQIEGKILRGEGLTQSDISGLTAYELRVLRNVHFARYGRKYERPGLGDYFYTRSWYQPSDSNIDGLLNATDKSNINLILESESALKIAADTSSGASLQTSSTSPTNQANSTNQTYSSAAPSAREFKRLKIAQGDYLLGYKAVNKATNAAEVVRRFGKPVKSADLNDFYKSKILFYDAHDEFGNPCYVKLQFVPICAGELNCYGLIGVATEPK